MPARVVFELRLIAVLDGAVSCMVSFQCRLRRSPSTTNRLVFYQISLFWLTVETADDAPPNRAAGTEAGDWLGANRRLVWLLAVVAGGLLAGGLGAAVAAGRTAGGWRLFLGILAAGSGLLAAVVAVVAGRAAVARMSCRGETLVVRTGPFGSERLPLDVVECFFLGSQLLDRSGSPTRDDEPAFRVGTLVVRVAERAVAGHAESWTARGPWAVWEDGYLIIDGRWTEPLTVETVRRVNGRLAQAKRAPVVDGCRSAAAPGSCGS
jgi:hypothetical protein